MPIVHTIAAQEEMAFVTSCSPVNLDTIRDSILGLANEPGFSPDFRILVDLRDMDYAPSNEDIQIIAENLGRMKDSYCNRIAVVVAGDLHFGLFRMASTYADLKGVDMKIFRDPEEARAWLQGS